jgi:hypothetical protein
VCIVALAISAAYGWSLHAYFAADDFGLIGRFIEFPWSAWPSLFFRDWSAGLWADNGNELRPLSALTFMIDGRLWGADSFGYHLTNICLHVVCSSVVLLIGLQVFERDWVKALGAALLFALHPTPSRAVVWVSGRVDLLSAAGFLLAFYAFIKYRNQPAARWLAVAWAGYAFGVFSKESSLLMPLVAIAWDVFRIPRRPSPAALGAPYLGWAVVLGFYLYCRSFGVEPIVEARVGSIRASDVIGVLGQRAAVYAAAMFLPSSTLGQLEPAVTPHLPLLTAAAVLAAIAVIGWIVHGGADRERSGRVLVFYAVAWPLVTVAPLVITYLSVRHLYPATAGFALATIAALSYVRRPRVRFTAAVIVISTAAAQLGIERVSQSSALDLSRATSQAVAAAATRAARGDVLVLDVPATNGGMWVWAWASPFALRPPFTSDDLSRRMIVVERPEIYRIPGAWPRPGTTERLSEADGGGWIIAPGVEGQMSLRELSFEELASLQDRTDDSEGASFEEMLDSIATATQQQ